MLVRAIRTGFFGNKRIKEGQVFNIVSLKFKMIDPKTQKETIKLLKEEDQFSAAWMEKIDKEEAKTISKQAVKFDKEDNVEEAVI